MNKKQVADIFQVIDAGDVRSVESLLEHDPSLLIKKNTQGQVPLLRAAAVGQMEICKLLLDRGAKITAKVGRSSAVHLAARAGNAELARFLRDRGAPIDLKAKNDWTELHDLLWIGPPAAALILIELGMNATLMGKSYGKTNTPLHLAVASSHTDFYRLPGGHRRVVEALLDRGADPNVLNNEGESPLHVACREGRADLVALLLDRGGEIEARDSSGATPLFFAVMGGNLATIRLLLDRGAKLKAKLPDSAGPMAGTTPLMAAQQFGHRFVEQLLRERGAGRQFAAMQSTTNFSRAEIHSACMHGDVDDVRWILGRDPSEVRALRPMGFTSAQPLHSAAIAGHEAVVKLLIERGATINDPATFDTYTPLHSAATQGHAGVVKLLAEAGADLNANAGDRPALTEAVQFGYVDVVRTLLVAGANPNIENDDGHTPLWIALHDQPYGKAHEMRACAELLRAHSGHE